MSVAGLDLSLRATGVAVIGYDLVADADGRNQRHEPCVLRLRTVGRDGIKGEGYPERSRRIVAQTRRVLAALPAAGIDLAVIEGPSYGSQHGAQMDRYALWMGVYSSMQAQGVPIAVVAPGTREKWATGSVPRGIDRKARKARVLAAVRGMWPNERIRDDDEADALVLATIGAHHLGWPLPFETKPRHTTGLQAVEWPEGVGA